MSLQPEPKANQIIDRLNELTQKNSVTEFEIARLKHDASTLKSDNIVGYHVIEGMIACLAEDAHAMHQHHKAAIRLARNDSNVLGNYATSLRHMGFFKEAAVYAEQAFQLSEGSIGLLIKLIDAKMAIGQFFEANRLACKLNKLLVNEEQGKEHYALHGILEGICSYLERLSIKDDDLQPFFEMAAELMHSNGIYRVNPVTTVQSDEEEMWVSIEHGIKRSVSEVVELNVLFSERVAEHEISPNIINSIVIRYTSTL